MVKEKRLVPKVYRRLAEVAAEHYAYEVLGCIRTVRAVSTAYCRQDLFASDVLGRKPDGCLCAIQVTSGQDDCVTKRKRKLEAEVWHESDTVLILRLYWEEFMVEEMIKRNHDFQKDNALKAISEETTRMLEEIFEEQRKEQEKKMKEQSDFLIVLMVFAAICTIRRRKKEQEKN